MNDNYTKYDGIVSNNSLRSNSTSVLSKKTGLPTATLSLLFIVLPILVGVAIIAISLFCCLKKKKKVEQKTVQFTKKFYIKPVFGGSKLDKGNANLGNDNQENKYEVDAIDSFSNHKEKKMYKLKTAIFRKNADSKIENSANNIGQSSRFTSHRELMNKSSCDNSYLQYETINKTKQILKKKIDLSASINAGDNIQQLPHFLGKEGESENVSDNTPNLPGEVVIRITEQSIDKRNNFRVEQEQLNKLKCLSEIDNEEVEGDVNSIKNINKHGIKIHRKKDKTPIQEGVEADNKSEQPAENSDNIYESNYDYPYESNPLDNVNNSNNNSFDKRDSFM